MRFAGRLAGRLADRFTPTIGKHLLRDEDEVIVDVVDHHWVCYSVALLEVVLALGMLFVSAFGPASLSLVAIIVAVALVLHAVWQSLVVFRDRFVITNLRVFRISGVFSERRAIMPMVRILDITVQKPLLGRLIGYGHFVFESAAQEQGLRDIRFVARPDERDKTIQRLIAIRGLR
ncbi:MAG: PH domain-containing protein [Nocardioides sp.]